MNIQYPGTDQRPDWAQQIKELEHVEEVTVNSNEAFSILNTRFIKGKSTRRRNFILAAAACITGLIIVLSGIRSENNGLKSTPYVIQPKQKELPKINESNNLFIVNENKAAIEKKVNRINKVNAVFKKVNDTIQNNAVVENLSRDSIVDRLISSTIEAPRSILPDEDDMPVIHVNTTKTKAGSEELAKEIQNPFRRLLTPKTEQPAGKQEYTDHIIFKNKNSTN